MKTSRAIKILVNVYVWTFDCVKRVAKSEERNCKILNLMQTLRVRY